MRPIYVNVSCQLMSLVSRQSIKLNDNKVLWRIMCVSPGCVIFKEVDAKCAQEEKERKK